MATMVCGRRTYLAAHRPFADPAYVSSPLTTNPAEDAVSGLRYWWHLHRTYRPDCHSLGVHIVNADVQLPDCGRYPPVAVRHRTHARLTCGVCSYLWRCRQPAIATADQHPGPGLYRRLYLRNRLLLPPAGPHATAGKNPDPEPARTVHRTLRSEERRVGKECRPPRLLYD